MTMAPISVVATIKAKLGREEELLNLLKQLVENTHQEPGCLTYALHRSQSDPATFIFVEKWASETDLQDHFRTPHVQDAMRQKDELIDVLEIAPLIPLSGGLPTKNR